MEELDAIYRTLLTRGLIAIRDAASLGEIARCKAEAEHLHNVPALIGEPEMAFEGLCIELMKNRVHPTGFAFRRWRELGETFGLDRESVFDGEFWSKFLEWGSGGAS